MCRAIFVFGCPRSGTTYTQRLLSGLPNAKTGQESHLFSSYSSIVSQYEKRQKNSLRGAGLHAYVSRSQLISVVRSLWDQVTMCVRPGEFFIEKTPDHVNCINLIEEVVPEAKFVLVVRDSRAVVASLLAASESEWGKWWAPSDPKVATSLWVSSVSVGLDAARSREDRFCIVRFEDLIRDPQVQLQRLTERLGMSYSQEELSMAASRVNEKNSDEPKGFFRHGKNDQWRRELSWRTKLHIWNRTSDYMKRLGYNKDGTCDPFG